MMHRQRWTRFLLLVLLGVVQSATAALHAWVDSPDVAAGEAVRLTLAHDGQTNSRPDLAPLKRDFDILGSSTSSNLQIVNGKASSTTQVELSLAPKRSGQLTIPPITWDSDRSPALTLNVTANAASSNSGGATGAPAATNNKVFMETDADPKSPYVQAATQVTVRVYTAVPLSHGDLEFPDTDAATVRQVGSDTIGNVVRNGQPYQVITRHYSVFPQHSGKVTIDGPTLNGEIPGQSRGIGATDPFQGLFGNSPFSGMLGARKPIRLHAEPIVLDVRARPASAGTSYWLPARNVSLEAHWTPSQLQTHVGDPITLDLKLQADGLTAAQLPDLSTLLSLPAQLKAYPDQPKLQDEPQGDELIGSREQSIALIADEAGQFTIPELHLTWWDTRANQTREAILPARTLSVQPAPGSGTSAAAPAQSPLPAASNANKQPATSAPAASVASPASEAARWKWISLVLGLLWLGTLAAWLVTRTQPGRRPPTIKSEGDSGNSGARARRSAFLTACRNNDAREARRNLLLWANAEWRGAPIPGLSALAKRLDDANIMNELRALDRACYGEASWSGAALAELLGELPLPRQESRARHGGELAPLYR